MQATRFGAVVLPLLLLAGPAGAQENCAVPDYFVQPYLKFAQTAQLVREGKPLEILVLSSAPSQTRIGEKLRSYPLFLEQALRERLPSREFRVTTHAEPRSTIGVILPKLAEILEKHKPSLVIWQTGTVEALRGVDPDIYERKLEAGVETIRKAKVDLLLVNTQYSPRTMMLGTWKEINDRIKRVSSYADVPLFNRYDVMQHWNDNQTFDFTALKNDGTYEKVHRCLGLALAEYVSRAASFAEVAKLPK
jgi:hypothetical protein